MDDLKTYAKSDEEHKGLLKIVKGFSDDIRMELGLDKCAKATFKRGKLAKNENIELDVGTTIQDLEQEGTYKYLGLNEGDGIQHAKMKEKIRKEYYRKIRLVFKSELNAANRIDAINTLAVPVVPYSFNIINWKMEELMKLDRKTRKFLTMTKCTTQKLMWTGYISLGGRGFVQLEITYKTTTIGLNSYLNNKDDYLLKMAREHDRGKKTMSIHHQAAKFGRELSLPEAEVVENEPAASYARRVKLKAKYQALEQLKSKWQEKPLHGQYQKRTKEKDVNHDKTHNWLSTPGLKSETEGFIIPAQDQCIKTNYYRNKMAPTQCAESVGYFKKKLTTLSLDALNLPRQSTYKDTIKLQHVSTGQSANTITSKYKINTTNMNQLL